MLCVLFVLYCVVCISYIVIVYSELCCIQSHVTVNILFMYMFIRGPLVVKI